MSYLESCSGRSFIPCRPTLTPAQKRSCHSSSAVSSASATLTSSSSTFSGGPRLRSSFAVSLSPTPRCTQRAKRLPGALVTYILGSAHGSYSAPFPLPRYLSPPAAIQPSAALVLCLPNWSFRLATGTGQPRLLWRECVTPTWRLRCCTTALSMTRRAPRLTSPVKPSCPAA